MSLLSIFTSILLSLFAQAGPTAHSAQQPAAGTDKIEAMAAAPAGLDTVTGAECNHAQSKSRTRFRSGNAYSGLMPPPPATGFAAFRAAAGPAQPCTPESLPFYYVFLFRLTLF